MLPDMGRLQPQARELEEAVLGALMLEKDAYSIVSEILKPECFYEKAHEKIYAAIVDLALSQRPVDMLTVTEQLKKRENRRSFCGYSGDGPILRFGVSCIPILDRNWPGISDDPL